MNDTTAAVEPKVRGRPFQRGHDPRRKTEGFRILPTLANAPKPGVSPYAHANLLPEQYQVRILPDVTKAELLVKLAAINDFTENIHRRLANTESEYNNRAVGRWHRLAVAGVRLAARIEGNGLRPDDLGHLTQDEIEKYRASVARILSASLSKLQYNAWYVGQAVKGDKEGRLNGYTDQYGVVHDWVENGLDSLVGAVQESIKQLVQLERWQAKNKPPEPTSIQSYQKIVGGGIVG